ncbi:hypothetical protein DL96DRAFT_1614377 [Flagelloscypha sp. PMI_526]|nr:hypothetical protein DL96DRAFT_1614377 [Flagelloscypha sp. PMI_526]
MPKDRHQSLPPNAGLPAEIWIQIIEKLPTHERIRLRHLSVSFWEAGLNAKYKLLVICVRNGDRRGEILKIEKRVEFYLHPFISKRVLRIILSPQLSRYWVKPKLLSSFLRRNKEKTLKSNEKLAAAVENLIPNLVNIQNIKICNDDDGGPYLSAPYFRTLLSQKSKQLVALELDLGRDLIRKSRSLALAEEIGELAITFPKLQHFSITYHRETLHAWMRVIRSVLINSSELQTLNICLYNIWSDLSNHTVVPLSSTLQYKHISVIKLSGYNGYIDELEFMKSYGPQLKEIHLLWGTNTALGLLSATPLPLLQRLDTSHFNDTDYQPLMDILLQLPSLNTLTLRRTRVPRGSFLTNPLRFKALIPSLERLCISDGRIDLDYLDHLASSCPNLKCLTLQAYSSIRCDSALLEIHDIQDTAIRISQEPVVRSFALSLREAKPLPASWKLETFFIYMDYQYCLPEIVIKHLPRLVPNLPCNSEVFYRNWDAEVNEYNETWWHL